MSTIPLQDIDLKISLQLIYALRIFPLRIDPINSRISNFDSAQSIKVRPLLLKVLIPIIVMPHILGEL